jgi:hypothetical protein
MLPSAVIECMNKISRIVRENDYSRYPKSNELLAGTISAGLNYLQYIVPAAQFL